MKKTAKIILKKSMGTPLFRGMLSLMEKWESPKSNLLRVITYHRVDELDSYPDHHPGMISSTPDQFLKQIKMLTQQYHVVSLQEVIDAVHNNKQLPDKSLLITFDDAYQDFSKNAWPVLKKYSLPVTVFVPTGYPDQPDNFFWWDRLHAALKNADQSKNVIINGKQYSISSDINFSQLFRLARNWIKSLPHEQAMRELDRIYEELEGPPVENIVMGWDELRKLSDEGVTLAPHTRTHPLLNQININSAMDEIVGSFNDLKEKIGNPLPVLAYPAGGASAELTKELEKSEIQAAFTTQRGLNSLEQDSPYLLRRINIGGNTTLPVLRSQLLSQSRLLNKYW